MRSRVDQHRQKEAGWHRLIDGLTGYEISRQCLTAAASSPHITSFSCTVSSTACHKHTTGGQSRGRVSENRLAHLSRVCISGTVFRRHPPLLLEGWACRPSRGRWPGGSSRRHSPPAPPSSTRDSVSRSGNIFNHSRLADNHFHVISAHLHESGAIVTNNPGIGAEVSHRRYATRNPPLQVQKSSRITNQSKYARWCSRMAQRSWNRPQASR